MNLTKIQKPFNFILFGASGDLAKLKLFPALYELVLQKRFAKKFTIVGFARSDMNDDSFRAHVEKSLKANVPKALYDQSVVDEMLKSVFYHQGQYDHPESFETLADRLLDFHQGKKAHQLAYLSVPPSIFNIITRQLAGIRHKVGSDLQVMMEKPFGESRQTAGELFKSITNDFDQKNLFLIDHYLGKPPVQSILPLRFNNTILNLLLNGATISNIQISALETVGVEERIGYFEKVGIIKDMIQSHLLQILALIAMSMPVHNNVNGIRREKGNVLSALRYYEKGCGMVMGQYNGYRQLEGVDPQSETPTFTAFKCYIDLMEWYSVPIYIRTGKKLAQKHTYVVIEFKKPLHNHSSEIEANRLIIELFPKEQIQIRLINDEGKMIQGDSGLLSSDSLACTGDGCLPAYGKLILDAMLNEHDHFLSIDEIYASWHFIDDMMESSLKQKVPISFYEDGGEGPDLQHQLTQEDGFKWFDMKVE